MNVERKNEVNSGDQNGQTRPAVCPFSGPESARSTFDLWNQNHRRTGSTSGIVYQIWRWYSFCLF